MWGVRRLRAKFVQHLPGRGSPVVRLTLVSWHTGRTPDLVLAPHGSHGVTLDTQLGLAGLITLFYSSINKGPARIKNKVLFSWWLAWLYQINSFNLWSLNCPRRLEVISTTHFLGLEPRSFKNITSINSLGMQPFNSMLIFCPNKNIANQLDCS